MCGLHPTGLQACGCSTSRRKKEPRDSDRDISGLLDRGIVHESSWSDTAACVEDSGQGTAAAFPTWAFTSSAWSHQVLYGCRWCSGPRASVSASIPPDALLQSQEASPVPRDSRPPPGTTYPPLSLFQSGFTSTFPGLACQALPPSSVYISGQCAYHCCLM